MKQGVVAAVAIAMIAATSSARAHGEACTSRGGEDTCPQGEACTVQDGTAGVCAAPPCSSDLECVAPLARCDLTRTPPSCIQCRTDLECAAPRTCELDPRSTLSNLCVECSPGRTTCDAADAGHRCLFSKGACGCGKDEDCAPGRVCGPRSTCEAGARSDEGATGDAAIDRGDGASAEGGAVRADPLVAGGCATVVTSTPGPGPAPLAMLAIVASAFACLVRRRVRKRRGQPVQR